MQVTQKIPKIIHYCWFGNKPMSDKEKACVDSWHKFCPDYEILQWNDSNYDIHKLKYMEEAAKAGKWSFVTDYVRLDVLYQYGGFYFDTDVEMLKSMEPLRQYTAFIGFEQNDRVNDGQGIGAAPGCYMIKEMRDMYENLSFQNPDGSLNLIECPQYRTRYLVQKGLKKNGKRQKVEEMEIFPADYFCPKSFHTGKIVITSNTYSIHFFNSSWHTEDEIRGILKVQKVKRILGRRFGGALLQCYFNFKHYILHRD